MSPRSIPPVAHIPRSALLRFAVFAALLVIGFVALRWTPLSELFNKEELIWIFSDLRELWWAPLVLFALYLVASPIGLPISPLVFAGGLVFGVRWGWLYNFLGALVGATVSYLLARALGRDLVVHLAGESLVMRVEQLLERHGFWNLVRARFIPLPFALVNFGAALAGYPLPQFVTASVLGLAPSLLIYTYFGHALFTVATAADRQTVVRNLVVALILILSLTFLVPLRRAWKRRRYNQKSSNKGSQN